MSTSHLEALEVCLELAEGKYQQAICLGDLVGYGPDPNAVVERIKALAQIIIRGNHDKACAGLDDASEFNPFARLATLWTREALSPEHFEFLRNLPAGPVSMNGFKVVHGSLWDEDEYITGSSQAIPSLRNLEVQAVFFGHTHFQGGFMLTPKGRFQSLGVAAQEPGTPAVLPFEDGARYLINPGSIGQPRDGDWRAAFAIFDEEKNHVEYFRTPYDLPKTQEKMQKAGLPAPLIQRLEFGR